ncbi:hypothetical protein ACHAW6_002815 [Cyclotella cf. meneghiniana]
MGCIVSQTSYIASSAGSLRDYQKRFLETKTLGEGEFGVVKLAYDVSDKDLINSTPLAVKYLRKGYQFKYNTVYSPIKKEVMIGEVEILRRLNGECYNLKLVSVYETPSLILILTEYCEGGQMIPYVTQAFKSTSKVDGGLRTEDVSRMSYQLLSAVDHCHRHGVIHRDIKPENVMFCSNKRDSELRLIDFGSGTLDENHSNANLQEASVDQHHTFAGSAFYISPEMFQRAYTSKTDVWSTGVTLYVLVAGYPAERLQECFNILQSDKAHRIRNLPNIPVNMPNSFYEMLEGALTYRPKSRLNAGQLLKGEIPQFHITHGNKGVSNLDDSGYDAVEEALDDLPTQLSRTKSVLLEGSVVRHNTFLGYQSFERTVTAVLATMLPKEQLKRLSTILRNYHQSHAQESNEEMVDDFKKEEKSDDVGTSQNVVTLTNARSLQVVPVKDLIKVIQELNTEESTGAIKRIQSLEAYTSYDNYAYHISMLRQFVSYSRANQSGDDKNLDESQSSDKSIGRISSVHAGNVWGTFKSRKRMHSSARGVNGDVLGKHGGDMSVRSQFDKGYGRDCGVRSQPGKGLRRISTATGALNSL